MIYRVFTLIIFIVIIILIIKLQQKIENFNINLSTKKRIIYNIIPTFDSQYLATYIPEINIKKDITNNLIITRSLESNNWKGPILNGNPDEKITIVDLCFNPQKKLMCVGMSIDNNIEVYTIYIKENVDLRSRWNQVNSKENIRSITFDVDNKLMGCQAITGQIFKKQNKDIESEWIGPLNFDVPMKKIIFDKDTKLLGIGLKDNFIYKKKMYDWKNSKWDVEHRGDTEVFDIFHDIDGGLIASTYNGLMKQKHAHYMSDFEPIEESSKGNNILSFTKIMQLKTGIEFKDETSISQKDNITDSRLSKELNNLLLFKANTKNMCKLKKTEVKEKVNQLLKTTNQNREINEIEKLIKLLK